MLIGMSTLSLCRACKCCHELHLLAYTQHTSNPPKSQGSHPTMVLSICPESPEVICLRCAYWASSGLSSKTATLPHFQDLLFGKE